MSEVEGVEISLKENQSIFLPKLRDTKPLSTLRELHRDSQTQEG